MFHFFLERLMKEMPSERLHWVMEASGTKMSSIWLSITVCF